ncbi:class I SAM-dependent methyltransferase [Candidatus Latescibacterota bacterium]
MHTEPSDSMATLENPPDYRFENVVCYECGSDNASHFLVGQDDYTGKPGNFQYVRCNNCNLVYQNPRLVLDQIKEFYDEEYISHRKKKNWGVLTPAYNWALTKIDRDKHKLVQKYVQLNCNTRVLDVGCAVGTFLTFLREKYDCGVTGVDFKNLENSPGMEHIDFYCGLFYEQKFFDQKFDLITMWHYLEHDYDPMRSLNFARELLTKEGKLIIEIPRLDSLTFKAFKNRWPGVQAPQHTVLYDKSHLQTFVRKANLAIVDYLPYGVLPAYFYIYTGLAFKRLHGKGLDMQKAIIPYFIGQLLLSPILLFSKYLKLSTHTIVCKKTETII